MVGTQGWDSTRGPKRKTVFFGQNHSRNSITWLPGIEKGDFGGVFGIISKASIKDELKRLRLKTRGNLNTTQLLVKYCKGRFFFLYPYPEYTSK